MKQYLRRSVNDSIYSDSCIGCPGYPESHHQDEGHDVARVTQIFGKRSSIFLVVNQYARFQSSHHREDVEIGIDDGDYRWSQYEDRQGDSVSGHVAPIEHADESLAIKDRLIKAEKRRTAHHGNADPRKDHPALTSSFRLNGLVSEWFPVKIITK